MASAAGELQALKKKLFNAKGRRAEIEGPFEHWMKRILNLSVDNIDFGNELVERIWSKEYAQMDEEDTKFIDNLVAASYGRGRKRDGKMTSRAKNLDKKGKELRRNTLLNLRFTLDEVKEVFDKHDLQFIEPDFDLDELSQQAKEVHEEITALEKEFEKLKKQKTETRNKKKKPTKRKTPKQKLLDERKGIKKQLISLRKKHDRLQQKILIDGRDSGYLNDVVHPSFLDLVEKLPRLKKEDIKLRLLVTKSHIDVDWQNLIPEQVLNLQNAVKKHQEWIISNHKTLNLPLSDDFLNMYETNNENIGVLEEMQKAQKKLADVNKRLKKLKPPKEEPLETLSEDEIKLQELESIVNDHKSDLKQLLKKEEKLDKEREAILGKFDRRLREQIPNFDELTMEERANAIFEVITPAQLDTLHKALSTVLTDPAIKAAGLYAPVDDFTHGDGEIKYINPNALAVVSKAKEALLKGKVKTGFGADASEFYQGINSTAEKAFTPVIGKFDSSDPEHWTKIDNVTRAVYQAMELHKLVSHHVVDSAAVKSRIKEKESQLEKAKKKVEEHRIKI